LGALFAWCARPRVRAEGPWPATSVLAVGIFAAVIAAPCTAYLYLAEPDWALLYLVNAVHVPPIFVVPVAAIAVGALFGGFYGGARLVRSPQLARHHVKILAGAGVLLLVVAVLLRVRLGTVGTTAAFRAGSALPLGAVKIGYVLVALAVGVMASAGYTGWEIVRDGRRAPAR
jgi:hypothetical protein